MLWDSFIKVKNITTRPYFSYPHSCTSLQMVLINLRRPDLPPQYHPWLPSDPGKLFLPITLERLPNYLLQQQKNAIHKNTDEHLNVQPFHLLFIPTWFDFWQNCATVINEQFIKLFWECCIDQTLKFWLMRKDFHRTIFL